VDLSAVIFVVLALAWAVYLIPKALKHHDEMASDRLVESHSERVRILRRKPSGKPPEVTVEVTVQAEAAPADRAPSRPFRSGRPARSAAQRRRRVLGLLVLALAVVAGLSYFAVVPRWSTAVPVGLILLFLLVARLSVRRAQRPSLARRRPVEAVESMESEELRAAGRQQFSQPVEKAAPVLVDEQVDVPLHEETAVEASVLADDGSLWDPLPMTLPTYVSKARARRTVRTIELTGMQSSGHDEGDSAIAREAEAPTETGMSAERRKAAGA
jgi:membrane protein YdbS with pleckstrin-like domain